MRTLIAGFGIALHVAAMVYFDVTASVVAPYAIWIIALLLARYPRTSFVLGVLSMLGQFWATGSFMMPTFRTLFNSVFELGAEPAKLAELCLFVVLFFPVFAKPVAGMTITALTAFLLGWAIYVRAWQSDRPDIFKDQLSSFTKRTAFVVAATAVPFLIRIFQYMHSGNKLF